MAHILYYLIGKCYVYLFISSFNLLKSYEWIAMKLYGGICGSARKN